MIFFSILEGYVLNVQNAALADKASKPVVLRVKTTSIEGEPIDAVLCTLRQNTDQALLQLVFGYDVPVVFYITSEDKSAKLHLSGYFQPAPEDDGDDDEEDEDSEDEEVLANTSKNAEPKLVVEDVSGDGESSEDEYEDDDPATASFIRVCLRITFIHSFNYLFIYLYLTFKISFRK